LREVTSNIVELMLLKILKNYQVYRAHCMTFTIHSVYLTSLDMFSQLPAHLR